MKTLSHLAFCVVIGLSSVASCLADDWPQWLGPKRDGVWRESGILQTFPSGGPKILWRAEVAGGYAGPAVADNRVFVADYVITEGNPAPDPGFRNPLRGKERITCFNLEDGSIIWRHEYDRDYAISYPAGPRATPTVDGEHVYVLGAEGDLLCLKVSDGTVVWHRQLNQDYGRTESSIWGHAAHPLVHGDLLYCLPGGQGSIVVALDKRTGEEKWRALSAKEPGYCPPTIIEVDGNEQLIIWHPEAVNGLNPATGEVYWSVPLEPAFGMSIVQPVKWNEFLFVGGIVNQSLMLRFDGHPDAPQEVWRERGIGPVHSPAMIVEGFLYAIDRTGQLRCMDVQSGRRLWETLQPTTGDRPAPSATAFMVQHEDRFFFAAETGDLIIARLTPEGYEELSRVHLLEPTSQGQGRMVLWSAPAFAQKSVLWRNDKELIRVDLSRSE